MTRAVGIDLGTSNSCVAVVDDFGDVKVLADENGSNITPSIVRYAAGGVVVGELARRALMGDPANTLFAVKRLVGRRFASPIVTEIAAMCPYKIVSGPAGLAHVAVDGKKVSPVDVSAEILKAMKAIAERALGSKVEYAVVTVPAYFDDAQRQATKEAGARAGLIVDRIINEPTAAILASDLKLDAGARVAVVDLGGGTFDVSILSIDDDVYEVISTAGDTFLGGVDFDNTIVAALASIIEKQTGASLRGDARAMSRLCVAAETLKKTLSDVEETGLQIPFLADGDDGPISLDLPRFTRGMLERVTSPLLDRLQAPCERALEDAKCKASDVAAVVLVGGMTLMPAVQTRIAEIFQRKPIFAADPSEAVALGAARAAQMIYAGDGDDEQETVLLLDVVSHTLSIKTEDGFTVLVPRNASIPVCKTKFFSTVVDQQDHVDIELFQGDDDNFSARKRLGTCVLSGLSKASAGETRVKVDLTVDTNGILQVAATEIATGKSATVTVRPPTEG